MAKSNMTHPPTPVPVRAAPVPVKSDAMKIYEQGSGQGSEGLTKEDWAVPRIGVLQSNSPQVNKRESDYVKGAEPGHFIDSVNALVIPGEAGFLFIPCSRRKTYIEWMDRDAGGGFVADHGSERGAEIMKSATRNDVGRDMLPNGNQIVRTLEYLGFGINTGTGEPAPVAISFTSTQYKKATKWNTVIDMQRLPNGQQAPIFFRAYRMTTIPESNDKGNWFGWKIANDKMTHEISGDLPQKCLDFMRQVSSGIVKVQPHQQRDVAPGAADDDDGKM